MQRGIDAHRNADEEREQRGGKCKLQRRRQPVGDQVDHRRLELIRVAEFQPRGVPHKARELRIYRIVEAEVLPQLGALLRGGLDPDHHVDRIADEAEQRERDQRDREHHHDRLQQAADDEGEHQVHGSRDMPATYTAECIGRNLAARSIPPPKGEGGREAADGWGRREKTPPWLATLADPPRRAGRDGSELR